MAKPPTLSKDAYAIRIERRKGHALPYRWIIVDTRTRAVVETSEVGHRTMEAAFAAAESRLQWWLPRSN